MIVSVAVSPCPVVRCPDSILLPRHVTLRWSQVGIHRASTNTWNSGSFVRMASAVLWRAVIGDLAWIDTLIYCISFFPLCGQPSPYSFCLDFSSNKLHTSAYCYGVNIWLMWISIGDVSVCYSVLRYFVIHLSSKRRQPLLKRRGISPQKTETFNSAWNCHLQAKMFQHK